MEPSQVPEGSAEPIGRGSVGDDASLGIAGEAGPAPVSTAAGHPDASSPIRELGDKFVELEYQYLSQSSFHPDVCATRSSSST